MVPKAPSVPGVGASSGQTSPIPGTGASNLLYRLPGGIGLGSPIFGNSQWKRENRNSVWPRVDKMQVLHSRSLAGFLLRYRERIVELPAR